MYDEGDGESIEEAQNDFFQLGGHSNVVRVVQKHLECAEIQNSRACVLQRACFAIDSIAQAVARVGGIQAIRGAVKKHYPTEKM